MSEEQAVTSSNELTVLTVDIISAYVGHNNVHLTGLPRLIAGVHSALTKLGQPVETEAEKPVAPVSIRKSIAHDYLISMEDGKPYKSLRRHLSGRGLTPEQYRQKWGLPHDYPMTSASYAAVRSELAKAAGLGRQRTPAEPVADEPAPAKRGDRRKSA